MCKDWLKFHRIKCNGYVSELKAKIKSLKENVESPPKLQVEENVILLWWTTLLVISYLLSQT